jgi:TatD DNase family protein
MLDCHCHLDLYTAPSAVTRRAEAAGAFTIFVTNLPSAYLQSRPHVARHARVRLALGLHPLLAAQHLSERKAFEALAQQTSFIGEVGLDFSPAGKATADIQQESFAFVLRVLANQPKFISIHSRRAEARVLELLRQAKRTPVIFHWYTGPLGVLRNAISDGHYFSINPAMVCSRNGQKIVATIPRDRILTETDGPFVKVGNRQAEPTDVEMVENYCSRLWQVSGVEAGAIITDNFRRLIAPLQINIGRKSAL